MPSVPVSFSGSCTTSSLPRGAATPSTLALRQHIADLPQAASRKLSATTALSLFRHQRVEGWDSRQLAVRVRASVMPCSLVQQISEYFQRALRLRRLTDGGRDAHGGGGGHPASMAIEKVGASSSSSSSSFEVDNDGRNMSALVSDGGGVFREYDSYSTRKPACKLLQDCNMGRTRAATLRQLLVLPLLRGWNRRS